MIYEVRKGCNELPACCNIKVGYGFGKYCICYG